jgi:hypothetical protein
MTRVTASAASSTAGKYRNRDGNQQTSVDFDGRTTTLQGEVFKRQYVVSSRWHAEGQHKVKDETERMRAAWFDLSRRRADA